MLVAAAVVLLLPHCDRPAESVNVRRGVAPVVVTVTHAGKKKLAPCETTEPLPARVCMPELDDDEVCESGPCRTTYDKKLDVIGPAFAAHLAVCAGAPTVIVEEGQRRAFDVSRDADDAGAGGALCALSSPLALPYWRAFYDALDGELAHARAVGGAHALLIDVHTYGTLPAAPAPALILGAGRPFGATIANRFAVADWFGLDGVRERLLRRFRASVPSVEVWPLAQNDVDDGLFAGRFVLAHASAVGVDAVQLEISDGARDDAELAAFLAADAFCDLVAARASHAR